MRGGNPEPQRGLLLPSLFAIDEKDAALERQPQFIEFTTAAQVAGGATGTLDFTVPWRDFVCTGLGFTSETIGFPGAPGRWRLTIEDIGAQKTWQPHPWDVTAVVGGNFGTADSSFIELPVPWLFMEKTTIRIQMENRDAGLACLPTCVLVGYLTNWKNEVKAAIQRQSLELQSLQAQAGQRPPGPGMMGSY